MTEQVIDRDAQFKILGLLMKDKRTPEEQAELQKIRDSEPKKLKMIRENLTKKSSTVIEGLEMDQDSKKKALNAIKELMFDPVEMVVSGVLSIGYVILVVYLGVYAFNNPDMKNAPASTVEGESYLDHCLVHEGVNECLKLPYPYDTEHEDYTIPV